MTQKHLIPAAIALSVVTIAQPVSAQTLLSGDHSVDGSLCAGANCTAIESFFQADLKIKVQNPELLFEDVSPDGTPNQDWRIRTNTGGVNNFVIEDSDTGFDIFVIEGGADQNQLYITDDGDIGIGTSLPTRSLHIAGSSVPSIRLENETNSWDIRSNEEFAWFSANPGGTFPFVIDHQAPNDSLWIHDNGYIGLGTQNAEAPLEMVSDQNFNFFRITAEGAAVNDSVDITFTGGPLGTGQLRYNIVDGDNQEMSLDANGNMVLDGTLTTAGPTCSGGCDRVFDADYPLPSITDHAMRMWDKGYLPSVGPTLPHVPVNLTERQARMLNALEHAHIFIAQQNDELQRQDQALRKADADIARLQTALEAQQEQLGAQAAAMSGLARQVARLQAED